MRKKGFGKNFGKKRILIGLLLGSVGLNFYLLVREFWGFEELKEVGRLERRVERVVDGDTFDLGEERVRLAGIDAPEYPEGCLAERAKERLGELVLGRKVEIEEVERDNFGRSVAFVFY